MALIFALLYNTVSFFGAICKMELDMEVTHAMKIIIFNVNS